jgi:diaminopimelate epimerase
MTASGNDFVVVDNFSGAIAVSDWSEFARKVCRRALSVGADGLIVIEPSDEADFAWRFYNSDGSRPEMCGNGGRCAARFAYLRGLAGPKLRFKTLAGIIEAKVADSGLVKIKMVPARGLELAVPLSLAGSTIKLDLINTGVPHAVLFVPDLEGCDTAGLGRQIRYHDRFKPQGTNADFVQLVDKSSLKIRTYERGVEAETLACGTGATAVALVAANRGLVVSPVRLETSGKEQLVVYFENSGPDFGAVHLEGKTRLVYEGVLYPEAL